MFYTLKLLYNNVSGSTKGQKMPVDAGCHRSWTRDRHHPLPKPGFSPDFPVLMEEAQISNSGVSFSKSCGCLRVLVLVLLPWSQWPSYTDSHSEKSLPLCSVFTYNFFIWSWLIIIIVVVVVILRAKFFFFVVAWSGRSWPGWRV